MVFDVRTNAVREFRQAARRLAADDAVGRGELAHRLANAGGVGLRRCFELFHRFLRREEVKLFAVLEAERSRAVLRDLVIEKQHRILAGKNGAIGVGRREELLALLRTGEEVGAAAVNGAELRISTDVPDLVSA